MRSALVLPFTLAIAGCHGAQIPSTDVATDELSISISIESNGTESLARIYLEKEMLTSVTLVAPDHMSFGLPGQEVEVSEVAGYLYGRAESAATELDLVLERGDGERVTSFFTLPPAFTLQAPAAPVSRAQPIVVTWDAAEGAFRTSVQLDSTCTAGFRRELQSDPGSYAIQPADYTDPGDGPCDFTVKVQRVGYEATFSPALAATYPAILQQTRTVTFATLP